MEMQFTLEFYVDASGREPVRVFLDELEREDPRVFLAVAVGLERLKRRDQHRPPLCKALGGGLFELRHRGSLNSRVLWFFFSGRRIILAHGIRHKAQALPAKDIELAASRREDWLRRNA